MERRGAIRTRFLRRAGFSHALCACLLTLMFNWLVPENLLQTRFVGSSPTLPRRSAGRIRASATGIGEDLDTGVMIANLGSPESPTAAGVRPFLSEFLHDYRVVDISRWLWCPILHGIILRFRPSRIAKAYESIWTPDGAPLISISKGQRDGLASELLKRLKRPVKVVMGMSYGNPSIKDAMQELEDSGVRKVVVLPLYPQYSSATTASIWDYTAKALLKTRKVPEVKFIHHYHDDPGYIQALVGRIQKHWDKNGKPEKLLFSFHGIPVRYKDEGDYYNEHCEETAKAVAKGLGLPDENWYLSYQSQFGKEEWLSPKTDQTLESWGKQGLGRVDVICPGFAADCLETIEEINEENREIFQEAGGGDFHYIPALNDGADHISVLASIVERNMA